MSSIRSKQFAASPAAVRSRGPQPSAFNMFRRMSCVLAFATALASAPAAHAQGIVQEYYVPLPEAQLRQTLLSVASNTGSTMDSVVSIVVAVAGTRVVYDHWEDGYEIDLNNPTQSSTRVWGDGNNANGIPPGFANDPASFSFGAVIPLRNLVTLPRNASTVLFDGRDRVGATRGIVISRALWATVPGPLLADAVPMSSTIDWGTSFVMPVGQNVVFPSPSTDSMFEWCSILVMAERAGTTVQIDIDGNGSVDQTTTLGQGESYLANGGVMRGATVNASKPVQVTLVTGDINANYESRWYAIPPTDQWSSDYYSPVGTAADGDQAYVWLYNDGASAITIDYTTQVSSGSFSIAAGSTYQFLMPQNSGGRFASQGGEPYFAVETVGARPTQNNVHDWGFNLVPSQDLTNELVVGWGPGSRDLSQNGSPVWVTGIADTTVYVDYNGDRSGPNTDPNGGQYDVALTLDALEVSRIYEPDRDQTGMRLYTLDGTMITAAWGQDPAVAGPAEPFLDIGTVVPNFPVPTIIKTSEIVVDAGAPGLSIGDTMLYSITLNNQGLVAIGNALVLDTPPPTLTYVPGTTQRDGNAIADSGTTPFPLDEGGITIPVLPRRSSTTISYQATIVGSGSITNTATSSTGATSTSTVVVPPPAGSNACVASFTNSSGTGVAANNPGDNLYVTITDADANTAAGTAQQFTVVVENTTGGDYETITLVETGVNTGVFRNTTGLASSATAGLTPNDGTLNMVDGDTLEVVHVDPLFGDTCNDTDAIVNPPNTKILYLSTDGAGSPDQDLDRIDPVAAGDATTAQTADLSQGTSTVAADTTSSGTTASALSLSFSHTTNAGSNRLLLVGVSVGAENTTGSAGTVSTVTYGGQSLTFVGAQTSADTGGGGGDVRSEIWMLNDAGITARSGDTLLITIAGATNRAIAAGATTFTGVNQASPLGTYASNTADSTTTGSVTATSAVGDLVFGTLAWDQGATVTSSTSGGQAQLWNVTTGGLDTGVGNTKPGAASVTLNWTSNMSQDYAASAVSIRPASDGGVNNTTFTMTPTLCESLVLPVGSTLSAQTYFSVISGSMPASPNITATLRYGVTTIATSTSTSSDGTRLTFTFAPLGSTVTVPSGQAIELRLNITQSGVLFRVDFDSMTAPSFVSVPTSTVIHADSVAVYDAAYPGGTATTSPANGQTVYVRAVVGDPFGSYDITSLALNIDGPGAADDISTTLTNPAGVVADNGCSATFEYEWNTGSTEGAYSVGIVAREGTENTVTDSRSTSVTLSPLDLGTPCADDFTTGAGGASTTIYATDEQVCVRIGDIDENALSGTAETVLVTITSSAGDSESLTLTETGVNTGSFTGCIPASSTVAGTSGNGTIYAPTGTALSNTYTDADDNSDVCTDTATVPIGSPAIDLTKTRLSPSDGQIIVGEAAQYRVRVANTGNTTLATVQVIDTFPAANLAYVSASPAPNTVAAGTLTWNNVGPLAPGQSVDLIVNFTGAASANPAINSATVNATGGLTDTDTANVIITNPDLTVTKTLVTPNPGPANLGDSVTFNIVVQNTGDTVISSLPLEDTFSASCFTYLSASVPPDGVGSGSIVWTDLTGAGTLGVGSSTAVTVTLRAAGDCNPAANLALVEFATDTNGDAVPPDDDDATIVTRAASISGSVFDDEGAAGFGGGDIAIRDVTIRLFSDPNGDGNPADGTLLAITTTLADGSYEFLNLPLGNYVVVETDPIGYRTIDDVQGSDTDNRISVVAAAYQLYPNNDFLDDLIDPATYADISGQVRYDTDTDGNLADADAGIPGVTIDLYTDPDCDGDAADGILFISTTTLSGGSAGNYAFNDVPPICYVIAETDPAGFYSTGDAGGSNDNVITINLPPSGSSTGNDFLDTDVNSANLSITKSDTGVTQQRGGTFTYTVLVSNAGPHTASSVQVVDALDSETSFVSSTGGCVEAPVGTLTCALGNLAASASTSFTITVTVSGTAPQIGTLENGPCTGSEDLCNVATVSSSTVDPVPGNNTADEPTDVEAPAGNLSIHKSDDPDAVRPGGTLTYTIVLSNPTNVPLDNVEVVESYDSRTTFVSATPAPDLGNNRWLFGTLLPGDVETITITLTVATGLSDGTVLTNSAVMTADNEAPTTVTEPTTVATPAACNAELAIDKTANPTSIPAGGVLTYTVTVRNTGSATAYDVVLNDVLPGGLTYRNAIPAPTLQSGQAVQWDVGDLPPGGASTYKIFTEVAGSLPAGMLFENTATATGSTGGATCNSAGLTAQGTATSSTSGPGTDCSIVMRKRHVGVVMEGNDIVYRCLWCDPCVDAEGVSVIDQVPPGLQIMSVSSRDPFTIDHDTNQVRFDIGTLPAGRAGQAYITVRVPEGTEPGVVLENIINFQDAALRTKTGTDVAVVGDPETIPSPRAAASLTVSGTKRAIEDGTINATLRYRNVGAQSSITALATSGIEVTRAYPPPSVQSGAVLVWNNIGETGVIKIRGRARIADANARGAVTSLDVSMADSNTGQVIVSGLDTAVVDAAPTGGGPNPPTSPHALSMTLTGAKLVSPGLTTQFLLRYRNLAQAGDAVMKLPDGLIFQSAIPAPSVIDGNEITWSGVRAGSGTIKVRATVAPDLPVGSILAVGTTLLSDSNGTLGDEHQMTVR